MSVRPTRPALRERYDRRQQQVVYQAAKAFAKQGYDQTTMQDLAARMDLATGALYHYFAGKEDLLTAICDQLMEPLLEQATELLAGEQDPEQQLRALVRLWVAHVIEHRDHMLVFQQERHLIESGDRWRKVRASRKAFERLAAQALQRARPDADVAPGAAGAAGHGQPHGAVVSTARGAVTGGDRRRVRGPRPELA